MAIPSQKKTFGLEDCRDLLRKLEWEIEGLRNTPPDDLDGLAFRAFNAFVTAWHMGDWVWKTMTEDQHEALRNDWAAPAMKDDGSFRGELRKRSRTLALCREIATASKHFDVTQRADETIDAVTSATVSNVIDNDGNMIVTEDFRPVVVTEWVLKVLDRDQRRPVLEVLDRALEFWTQLIYPRKIGE